MERRRCVWAIVCDMKPAHYGMMGFASCHCKTVENKQEKNCWIFARSFDEKYGGFGQAPKFPTPHNLIFLMLYSIITHDDHAFHQVKATLEKMRRGGIFDHIGYGFSRYSTDNFYLVHILRKCFMTIHGWSLPVWWLIKSRESVCWSERISCWTQPVSDSLAAISSSSKENHTCLPPFNG